MLEFEKPRWLNILTEMVRPGGVALMFLVITTLPLIFAIIELGLDGVGFKMAGVLTAYFKAVPDVYYNTLQVMFLAYVAGKSGEKIAGSLANKKEVTVNTGQAEVNTDQRGEG